MRIPLSIHSACLFFVLPHSAFAASSATLCFTDLSSPVTLTTENGEVLIEGVQPGASRSVEQIGGDLDIDIDTFDDGVQLTFSVELEIVPDDGAEASEDMESMFETGVVSETLGVVLDLEPIQHEDVTFKPWPVTDHAHIDPSYLPDKIIGKASIPTFAPGCASPLEIEIDISDDIGIAPWQDIEFTIAANPVHIDSLRE